MCTGPLQLHQQTVHVCIPCFGPNAIHIVCSQLLTPLSSSKRQGFSSNMEVLQSTGKRRNCSVHMALLPQLLLEFVKIDSVAVLNYVSNEHEICCAENTMVPSDRIFVWVVNSPIMVVEVESLVYKQFHTEKVANVFDSVPILKKCRNVEFCVVGHNVDWHWRWSEGQVV